MLAYANNAFPSVFTCLPSLNLLEWLYTFVCLPFPLFSFFFFFRLGNITRSSCCGWFHLDCFMFYHCITNFSICCCYALWYWSDLLWDFWVEQVFVEPQVCCFDFFNFLLDTDYQIIRFLLFQNLKCCLAVAWHIVNFKKNLTEQRV